MRALSRKQCLMVNGGGIMMAVTSAIASNLLSYKGGHLNGYNFSLYPWDYSENLKYMGVGLSIANAAGIACMVTATANLSPAITTALTIVGSTSCSVSYIKGYYDGLWRR